MANIFSDRPPFWRSARILAGNSNFKNYSVSFYVTWIKQTWKHHVTYYIDHFQSSFIYLNPYCRAFPCIIDNECRLCCEIQTRYYIKTPLLNSNSMIYFNYIQYFIVHCVKLWTKINREKLALVWLNRFWNLYQNLSRKSFCFLCIR